MMFGRSPKRLKTMSVGRKRKQRPKKGKRKVTVGCEFWGGAEGVENVVRGELEEQVVVEEVVHEAPRRRRQSRQHADHTVPSGQGVGNGHAPPPPMLKMTLVNHRGAGAPPNPRHSEGPHSRFV